EKSQEAAALSAASPKALAPSPAAGPAPSPTQEPAKAVHNGESMVSVALHFPLRVPPERRGGGAAPVAAAVGAPRPGGCRRRRGATRADGEAGAGGGDSDDEDGGDSEELDDIELIFTTEETKELGVLQEDLVPIADAEEDGVWPPLQFESADGEDGDAAAPALKPTPVAGAAPVSSRAKAPCPPPPPSPPPRPPCHNAGRAPRAPCSSRPTSPSAASWTRAPSEPFYVAGRLSRRNTLPAPLGFPPVMLLAARTAAARGGGGAPGSAWRWHGAERRPPFASVPQACGGAAAARARQRGGAARGRARGRDFAQRFPRAPILVERCRGAKRENEAQTDITRCPALEVSTTP
ncbi:Uncharacterized protein GBIM_18856, partial [Gryllus bimaculatus]